MRSSIGDIVAAPGGRDAILRLFDECGAVASAAGFKPRDAFVQNSLALVTEAGSPLKWSMLRDIERGSTTEGEHILGDMVARAHALGVQTPILDLARTHVAAYEIGRSRAAATL
jgi:2-dehydropantoate 2-reductase